MNINYSTSIKGDYTLYDENMNVLCETNNLITDWGMRRFVGDRSVGAPHPVDTDQSQQAFVNNIRHIMLGTGTTLVSTTDFQLVSGIPLSEYTTTNDIGTTGTLLSSNDERMDIIFTRTTRFQMASSFNPSLAPSSTYNINEIGCSWSTILSANNRYGIFSRANLPSVVTVRPNNVIFAKYQLTITTDANQIKESMPHFRGTGAIPQPANKTNVRQLPLYTLRFDGEPSNTLNQGNVRPVYYETQPPLFEDAGSHNLSYVGNGQRCFDYNVVFGAKHKKDWWLQLYTTDWSVTGSLSATSGGANPLERFNTFTSTTSANITDYRIDVGGNQGSPDTVYTSGWAVGGETYDIAMYQNLNLWTSNLNRTGRKLREQEVVLRITPNTWNRKIQFLFTPSQFKQGVSVINLYRATPGDWGIVDNNPNCPGVYFDAKAAHNYGVVTVFNSGYTPPSNLFNGVEYNFTFTRN